MRDIEFRGKRISDGKWIYGYYVGITKEETKTNHTIVSLNNAIEFEVDPDTVGQYAGLKDKNNQKIFEADIVKGDSPESNRPQGQSEVFYGHGQWQPFAYLNSFNGNDYEIIGNIHESPELLSPTQ